MMTRRSGPVLPLFPVYGHRDPDLQILQTRPEPEYLASGRLRDRVALITSAGSPTGHAVALLFAREGADLALVYGPGEESAAGELQRLVAAEGRRALLLSGEATDPGFCADAVWKTVRELGRLDVLINNAVLEEHREGLEAISDAQWNHTVRWTIDGYFYMTRAALPHLSEGAAIINCGCVTGGEQAPELVDHAVVNGAIEAFTHALAHTLGRQGIRANCISHAHGAVDPERLAPTFVFLASGRDASQVNGEVLTFTREELPPLA